MIDPRASANGNLNEKRIDLMLIASLVERGTRVLDIGCGNGELMELLVAERDVDARGLELSQQGVNACVSRGLAVVQGNADTDLSYYPDQGFDTVEANHRLGFEDDERDFQLGAAILKEMRITNIKLITNNPSKISTMNSYDINVVERIPLKVGQTKNNLRYLETKARKSGHLM